MNKKEQLDGKISYERFIAFSKRFKVLDYRCSTNNYGEWFFITVRWKNRTLTFWGMGYNETLGCYEYTFLRFYDSYLYKNSTSFVDKKRAMKELAYWHDKTKEEADAAKNPRNALKDLYYELTDDLDDVQMEFEDYEG